MSDIAKGLCKRKSPSPTKKMGNTYRRLESEEDEVMLHTEEHE